MHQGGEEDHLRAVSGRSAKSICRRTSIQMANAFSPFAMFLAVQYVVAREYCQRKSEGQKDDIP